ncbi:hypothetical protein FIBSPDRAFT_957234 [Athelia psychrophila]|uniref:Uncharacterized protein n=1 Tax=Athelia psychrophila TaxID=1759441 RepID=A0A166G396_9AGAM|nr:hypothetical protein FIBSPDRAFT_957234 [Fibularhizoctonia sp. CBS 109695]
MEASLQLQLQNYIRALEVLVQKGEPEPKARMALRSIVRECLTLVMSAVERGPDAVPPFSLSTTAGTTIENAQARDIDVTTIEHDARVLVHPWYTTSSIRSGSEDTLVEEESSEQFSSEEEEGGSSGSSEASEGWEDEEDTGSSVGVSEVDIGAPSTPSLRQPPADIWQELPPPRCPMYLNRAPLEDTSRWVNPSTRIFWDESPPMVMTASNDNREARPLRPASPNTATGPSLGCRRRRSLSVEIIDAVVRPATRRRISDQARRARRVAFLQERLEEDGLVFTGLPKDSGVDQIHVERASLRPTKIHGGCCLNQEELIFVIWLDRTGRKADRLRNTGRNTESRLVCNDCDGNWNGRAYAFLHQDLWNTILIQSHIHPRAEDLRSRLAEAFRAFPGSHEKHAFLWFRSGVKFEMRRFLCGVGNDFLTNQTEYDFSEFVANGLVLLQDDTSWKVMEDYRTSWFEEDHMILDSQYHRDAWWRDDPDRTLPADTWEDATKMVSEMEILAHSALTSLSRASVAEAAHLSHQNDRKQEIHRIIGGLESALWRGANQLFDHFETVLWTAFQHLPPKEDEKNRRWFMKGLRYEMGEMNGTIGVGLVNKVIPTPVPEVFQRVREAIDKDAIDALDSIKLALRRHTKFEGSPGWWDADLLVQPVFPPQSYDGHQASLTRTRLRAEVAMMECRALRIRLNSQAETAAASVMEVDYLQSQVSQWREMTREGPALEW